MLTNKLSLKKSLIGATIFGLLSSGAPDIAQAADFRITLRPGTTSPYRSQFNLVTGVGPEDVTEIPIVFSDAVNRFIILKLSTTVYNAGTRLDLNATRRNVIAEPIQVSLGNLGFTSFSGPFYEYSFAIPNYRSIAINPPPPPFDPTDGTIRFYVPSRFTYSAIAPGARPFTVAPALLPNPDASLLTSLSGFNTILSRARMSGYTSISFTSNVRDASGNLVGIVIETNPIPESHSSTGIIMLGLAGSLILTKKKIEKTQSLVKQKIKS